jgi:amino acid transporter
VHIPAVVAAGTALVVTLMLTGFALPQAEWFALPERIDEMKQRPREFCGHFVGMLLALCGLDTVSDLAGVMRKRAARPAGRTLCVVAAKAVMLHALLALAVSSLLSDPQLGERQVNLLPFLPADYAGQWAELAVAVLGDVLLLTALNGVGAALVEMRSTVDGTGDGSDEWIASTEMAGAPGTARHDG